MKRTASPFSRQILSTVAVAATLFTAVTSAQAAYELRFPSKGVVAATSGPATPPPETPQEPAAPPAPPPAPGDPHFANVSLLMHMENSLADTRGHNFSHNGVTFAGSGAYVGSSAAAFNGSAYASTPTGGQFQLAAGQDSTVEAWIFNAQPGARAYNSIVATADWMFYITHTDKLGWVSQNRGMFDTGALTVPKNVWTHVAAVRSAGVVHLYLNGTHVASSPIGVGATNGSTLNVGGGSGGNPATEAFGGLIDELRITEGVARYSGNFTPAAASLPDN